MSRGGFRGSLKNSRSMDAQVLFRLFSIKTTQSTTAITSIVFNVNRKIECKSKIRRIRHCEALKKPKQSKPNRHTERIARSIQNARI